MGRSPISSDETGLKKGPWTPEEDEKLIDHINKHGHGSWRALPGLSGLNRCGKSCRLRWTNYLRPDIKRGKFSQEEEQTILNLHAILGNKWSAIATHLPGRTDNEIKNFWNTHLKKKLIRMGFDPMTHRPRTDIFSSLPHLIALAKLIQNPNWELEQAMRLQTEAAQMSRLNNLLQNLLQPSDPTGSMLQLPNLPNNNMNPTNNFNLLESMAAPLDCREFYQETTPFDHLPDLSQGPIISPVSDDHQSLVSKGDDFMVQDCDFGALGSPWTTQNVAPPVAEAEGCGTSSYGSSQMWSELLLDDHIFNEIA